MKVPSSRYIYATLFCISIFLSPATQAFGYGFSTVAYPGACYTLLVGVAGSLVFGNTDQGYSRAGGFSYDLKTKVFTPFLPPDKDLGISAVNDAGQAVGTFFESSDSPQVHAFIRSGSSLDLIDMPGATMTNPTGINASGQVTGSYESGDGEHGFIWTNGTFETLDVPGATSTIPYAINDSGSVVGMSLFWSTDDNGNPRNEQAYFVKTGENIQILDFPGSLAGTTTITGINNSGQIVGNFRDANGEHGFVKNAETYSSIDFPGATFTSVTGISDSGLIYGETLETNHVYFIKTGTRFITFARKIVGITKSGQIFGEFDTTATKPSACWDFVTTYSGYVTYPEVDHETMLLLLDGD